MYRLIEDFVQDWKRESQSTRSVFEQLTDASLDQRVTPEGRSIGDLARHIIESLDRMTLMAGLTTVSPLDLPHEQENVTDLVTDYTKVAALVEHEVPVLWTDEQLTDTVNVFGQTWAKGKVLQTLISHQAHHRAQITVLMRQAGLRVPGVYGPSREEWAAMGMPARK